MAGSRLAQFAEAGEDQADLQSDRNPRLNGLRVPRGTSGGGRGLMRRVRTAALTPSGEPQPPELAGVLADARTPNREQPMAGEFHGGRETGEGSPSFHNPSQARTTGIGAYKLDGTANPQPRGMGDPTPADLAGIGRASGATFGAPTGMPRGGADALAALAGLPHFADGGTLPAGATGVVGENGPEEIAALPGGGTAVQPIAQPPGPAPSPAPQPAGGQPAVAADAAGLAGLDGLLAPSAAAGRPPNTTTAADRLAATDSEIAGLAAPDKSQYGPHGWAKAADIALGVGAAALTGNPLAGVGAYNMAAHRGYDQAEQDYQDKMKRLSGLDALQTRQATLEQQGNDDAQRQYEADQAESDRQKTAARDQDFQRQDLELRREQQVAAQAAQQAAQAEQALHTPAGRTSYMQAHPDAFTDWTEDEKQSWEKTGVPKAKPDYPAEVQETTQGLIQRNPTTGAWEAVTVNGQPAQRATPAKTTLATNDASTKAAIGELAKAPTREQAENYIRQNADALMQAGVDDGALERYLNLKFGPARPPSAVDSLLGGGAPATGAGRGGVVIGGVQFPGNGQ